jgi:hypothetical protein
LLAAIALCCGVLIHSTALACSCAAARHVGVLMPAQGDRVPRNARFWIQGDGAGASLRGPDGEPIAFERRTIEIESTSALGPSIAILEPDAPLEPGSGYRVQADDSTEAVMFDVQDVMDTTAPKPPELVDVEPLVSPDPPNSCGTYRGASLWLESEGITFVSLASEPDGLDNAPAGRAFDVAVVGRRGTSVAYGGACSTSWPGDDVVKLRFASFDIAGNYSGRTEPIAVDRPKPNAGGCTTATPGPRNPSSQWLLTASLGLLLLWRLRRVRLRLR